MRFFYVLCFLAQSVQAIDLSEVPLDDLHEKTIAYYFGSFDPFHKGHLEVVHKLLERTDYVLVVPTGVADKRKPHRTDPSLRREMIGLVFEDNPKILTSQMNPGQIQAFLRPHMHRISFKGVQGTEVLDEFENATSEAFEIYLQGKDIPPEKADTVLGAMMLIKTDTLIVPLRDPLSSWAHARMFHDFRLEPLVLSDGCGLISSSVVKKKLQSGNFYQHLVPVRVASFIREKGLYTISMN